MTQKINPAVLRALNLDASTAQIATHGGSGFASTYRITTPTTSIFVKTSSSSGAAVMFEGEHASLNAINGVVPSLCPKSLAWGKLDGAGFFLATEFLDLGSSARGSSSTGGGMSLAEKLAKLHSTPAPIPERYDKPRFGFPVTTCCGDTPQPNDFMESWADFFAQKRMMAILERGEKNNGKVTELRKIITQVVEDVVPRLLGDEHLGGKKGVVPVVVHGDLWSGNKGKGTFVGRTGGEEEEKASVEDVVFDPSVTYAHSEYDHGIMNMFGGFGSGFWNEYFKHIEKTEPVGEYADRVALYESYHHLNHYAIFGGGYKSGAMSLLKPLIKKYGQS